MATKKTEAQQKAQKKYMEKLSRLEITMPPERKQRIQNHAKEIGESVNAFLNRAADETIEHDKEKE